MRIANHAGRAVLLLSDDNGADIAAASEGRFGPDLQTIYDNWRDFVRWTRSAMPVGDVRIERERLGSPSPKPSQVVAIGLNYADHASETGFDAPDGMPPVFTKFPTAVSGPYGQIDLPDGGNTDWEVEVVAVVGRTAHDVTARDAWSYVAGLSVGQDLSERISQMSGPSPQFCMGKSFPGFAPMGPWLVTPDELEDKDDLPLGCAIDGRTVQFGRTSKLIFPIPALIARLSRVITLLPGDVIFTGTPEGVGLGMHPPRFVQPGESLRTWVDGIGEMKHVFR